MRYASATLHRVTGRRLLAMLRRLGCEVVRQQGSHVRVRCGRCVTTVPVHAGEDLGPGLVRAIERDLELCLGKGWLGRERRR
ncbi:MAG: type II toxin-antitoxin system HicA family toxin [Deltaproteobacteria bacterium]|nr:type II toxin-antitoxin system HicA family toxin [Deltaproteobacteria bacterium]